MSSYGICPDCHKAGWLPHKCQVWEWRIVEPHSRECDWLEVRARSADEAAQTAAEQWDNEGDYYLIRNSGQVQVIELRDPKTLMVTLWNVHAEAIPTYYANQVRAD